MPWICLTPGAPGTHLIPSLLWQETILVGRRSIPVAARKAQALRCQHVPLPRRQGEGTGKGVSDLRSPLGLCEGSQPHHRLGGARAEHQSRAGCSLPWLVLSSQPQPVCFRRLWQLLLCRSCGSEGTHWCCSFWAMRGNGWECDTCAGAGTGKRQRAVCRGTGARQGLAAGAQGGLATVSLPQEGWQPVLPWGCMFILLTFLSLLTASRPNSDPASPSTSSPMVQGPSHSFPAPENTSSGPTSQAATGPSCSSQLPELSVQPRVPATEQRATHPSPSEEQDTPQQRRGRGGRRRAPAAGAETGAQSPSRRGTARSSRTSSAPAPTQRARQRGTGRTRSRSPLQGRASGSHSQPRRRHAGSHTTAQGAPRSTRTSATPAAPRSSRASPLPARTRQSRQRGRARTRSRSPVGRRASTSRSRPRRDRGSRSRQRGPARARSRSRANHQGRRPHSQSRRRR